LHEYENKSFSERLDVGELETDWYPPVFFVKSAETIEKKEDALRSFEREQKKSAEMIENKEAAFLPKIASGSSRDDMRRIHILHLLHCLAKQFCFDENRKHYFNIACKWTDSNGAAKPAARDKYWQELVRLAD
jgi:hypothetical protein